jgi:pimeloyl-ACP methyl ester carboxylesterase
MKNLLTFFALAVLSMACQNNQKSEKTEKITESKPNLYYTQSGKGDITLIFVHGWGINGSYWDNQVKFFQDKYQVLTLDLPAHGKSPITDSTMSIAKHAQAIVELINYLKIKQLILIGHSMSGNINLHVYQQISDKVVGFIGIDNLQEVGKVPSAEEQKQTEGFLSALKKDFKKVVPQFGMGYLFHAKTDTLVKKRVIDDILNTNEQVAVSTLASLTQEYKNEQTQLPQLKIPLLLVVAEKTIKDEASLKKYCPNGYKYWSVKNTGHYPMIEQAEEFNQYLQEAILTAVKAKK